MDKSSEIKYLYLKQENGKNDYPVAVTTSPFIAAVYI